MSIGPFPGAGELKGFTKEAEYRVLKKRAIVGLDLNMDLLRDAKDDLDLELRLGFAMESGHREEDSSVNSSEEVDQPEQENNDAGAGRSYDCMFCKRGFTTAQALGGHMNIHRKDRAKNRPSSINSNKHEENYQSLVFSQPISSHQPPYYSAAHEPQMNYRTYFPAATSGTRPSNPYKHENLRDDQTPHHLNPFGDDWRTNLSLQFDSSHAEDLEKKKQGESDEEQELDLELRLGHDP
ncbi:hypothetical protein F0562_002463 [Nyssa sinensis]|uniref:C2H2-type domain-containing protein n=1 Tax=Nyssa sinensis TaxID=561372 RepID=A0A5J5C6I4_9ASTE|nr:hypothetical protein F0562_002463 [Nyssa sinensis]